jgi:hypothetical protein
MNYRIMFALNSIVAFLFGLSFLDQAMDICCSSSANPPLSQ